MANTVIMGLTTTHRRDHPLIMRNTEHPPMGLRAMETRTIRTSHQDIRTRLMQHQVREF